MKWKVLGGHKIKNGDDLVDLLLKNRGIKTEKQKREFFYPTDPMKVSLKSLGVKESEVKKAIDRIKQVKKNGEHVIVYGDYDADGITGTATLWETLHELEIFVLPHIPERFSEGYGLNLESVKKLKKEDPKLGLIITVDHGITAGKKVEEIRKMGIDMIISDHHQIGSVKPKPLALIYTTEIGGSALAWFFAREIVKRFKIPDTHMTMPTRFQIRERLQLAAVGTIADQLLLTGPNRSVVKYGLEELNKTKRPGFLELFDEARIKKGSIGTYEVGFIIAPRINSMGRLKHGLESLRLICTKNSSKAKEIAMHIGRTNAERQRIVDEVVLHARSSYKDIGGQQVIVLAHESYHEGVIGLAAAKLVEEFYRPAIVLSKKGEISKASARSIPGFNIISAIRTLSELYIEGGGHPMAAGFSIHTENIDKFTKGINKVAKSLLTSEVLSKKLVIDVEVSFSNLTEDLYVELQKFEPYGLGNPSPVFVTKKVEVLDAKPVGREAKHIKLKLRQDDYVFDSIYFGGGEMYSELTPDSKIDIVYRLERNEWNGSSNLQLVIKDIRTYN